MKRIYHHFMLWEEYTYGMWTTITGSRRNELLLKAIGFTGDAILYGSFMIKALDLWPYSCEHNLSNPSINRRAWIGFAATCIAIGCPEDITRLAWHELSEQQQNDANGQADKAIWEWEKRQEKKELECQNVNSTQMSLF